ANQGSEIRSIHASTTFSIAAGTNTYTSREEVSSRSANFIGPAGMRSRLDVSGSCSCDGQTTWELTLTDDDWAPEARAAVVGNDSGRAIEIKHGGVTEILPDREQTRSFAATPMTGSWRMRPLTPNADETCPPCP